MSRVGHQVGRRLRHHAAWLLAFTAACTSAPPGDGPRPVRIAVRGSEAAREISSLSYKGGFETKTLLYETLVKRGPDGRIAPCLAESWDFENDGRECVLQLRRDARFHDGSPVTAQAVREHFMRWVGLPEHDWLSCNQHIVAVRVEGPGTLRIVMDEPRALLPELCAINPCAIRAPSTLDSEGNFVKPVGSGPFAWEGADADGEVLHYAIRQGLDADGPVLARVDLVRFIGAGPDAPLDELLDGDLDLVVDSWGERIPRERLAALRADERVRVLETAGSSVVSLGFRTEIGPCADKELRERIRGALQRHELIDAAELGYADECFAFAAPTVGIWPEGLKVVDATPRLAAPTLAVSRPPALPTTAPSATPALRLLARSDSAFQPALGRAIAAQLQRVNIPVELALLRGEALSQAIESGNFDMRIESSWGVPYDPDISLNFRFAPPLNHAATGRRSAWGQDATITELVVASQRECNEDRRAEIYAKIQNRIDQLAILVPLYVPRRFAVVRADLPSPTLDNDLYRIDAASVAPVSLARQP